ncbi:MAG: prepilin-type N-terminal cleavage/methylation domain-containing protein [Actinomycetota bacterium]
MKEREQGFTLIELLVVILIIAILAAIAIPVFLNQRKKGWKAQVESTLKNMATSEESYLTSNTNYTTDLTALSNEGFKYATSEVTPDTPLVSGASTYCLRVVSAHDTNIVGRYDSSAGRPVTVVDGSLAAWSAAASSGCS